MDISILDSTLTVADIGPTAPSLVNQAVVRANVFRFLLSGVVTPGTRVVDLAAGPCIFAQIARDEGCIVTAVDARTVRKPSDEELGSIRFIQADIRTFELEGFDVLVCLGMLYHFDVEDQVRFLERCARTGVPMILETQIHVDALVPDSETGDWARKTVRRGGYEGVVFPEQDNPMASVGNAESFWATEPSLLQMIEDAGFGSAAVVDPIYQSKYGARRYFLLNCEHFATNPEFAADIAEGVERAKFADLVRRGRFEDARVLFERLNPLPENSADWVYRMSVAKMRMHFGEPEKAVQDVRKLRDHALGFGERWHIALLRCADFFDMAGEPLEAEKTRAAAYERIRDPAHVKSLLRKLAAAGQESVVHKVLAQMEERFADDADLLGVAANAYYSAKDYKSAERACRAALALQPANLQLHVRLAEISSRQGDAAGAAAGLESALALDPENPEILDKLIAVHLELKDKERAEHFARRLLGVAPLNPRAHFHLARALRGRHRGREVLEHAKRAAELEPGNKRYREFVSTLS